MDYSKINDMLSKLEVEEKPKEDSEYVSCFFSRELELNQLFYKDIEKLNNQNPRDSKIKVSSVSKNTEEKTSDTFNNRLNDYRTNQFKKQTREYFDIREINSQINKNKHKNI